MSGLTFESVFCGSDGPLKPSHISNTVEANENSSKSKADVDKFLGKTYLTILEEISKRVCQQNPSWSAAEIPGQVGVEFEMTLNFNGKTVKARAGSKQVAKQKAAREFLHQAVNDGKRVDFFIPGESDEEAHANIDRISAADAPKRLAPVTHKDVDRTIPTVREFPEGVPEKNWVGALQEKCQKCKLEAPCYEEVRIEKATDFIVTCTMGNQKTRGVKSKIKAAKNLAAWLMLKCVEEGPSAVHSFDDLSEDLDMLEREDELEGYRQELSNMNDVKPALVALLSDKKRFPNYTMDFLHPAVSALGIHQIILKIEVTSAESDDPKVVSDLPSGRTVFPGYGPSEEDAAQSACKAALMHFHTYNYTD